MKIQTLSNYIKIGARNEPERRNISLGVIGVRECAAIITSTSSNLDSPTFPKIIMYYFLFYTFYYISTRNLAF